MWGKAERGTPGFVVGDLEDLCGMRANPVSSIRLYDCRVPKENLLGKTGIGLKIGLAALDTGRVGIAAQALGIAQAALEESVLYMPISGNSSAFRWPTTRPSRLMIADMAVQVDAARMMVYRAAWLKDQEKPVTKAAAQAKLFASEAAGKVTDLAVQIHGGYGYSKAYAVERYSRDARVTRIYEGTSEGASHCCGQGSTGKWITRRRQIDSDSQALSATRFPVESPISVLKSFRELLFQNWRDFTNRPSMASPWTGDKERTLRLDLKGVTISPPSHPIVFLGLWYCLETASSFREKFREPRQVPTRNRRL